MKSEMDKMLDGELYDCGDPELLALWVKAKNLAREFNGLDYGDRPGQLRILAEMIGSHGRNTQITAPFFVDYGKFIHIGDDVEINMNCVFLDCNRITIGNNVLIAPNVQIYTVFHPLSARERLVRSRGDDAQAFAISRTAPVTIEDNCWIGGGCIILPGVTIGANSTIAAGSVVTSDIPPNSLAVGSPARVIRALD